MKKKVKMIQRIQTVYYTFAAICLIVVTFGVNVFGFQINAGDQANLSLDFNSYGISSSADLSKIDVEHEDFESLNNVMELKQGEKKFENKPIISFPFYIITILLAIMVIASILLFKKMPFQVRTGRAAFFFTFLLVIFVVIMYYVGGNQFTSMIEEAITTKRLGIGFYLLIIAVAFLFLGNLAVRRDIKLVKSLDRLR